MAIGTYIWIITLSVNGLDAVTKRYRLEWKQKQDYTRACTHTHTHIYTYNIYIYIYIFYKRPISGSGTHTD